MLSNKVWTTKKVNEEIEKIENGLPADTSAFYEGNTQIRNGNIVFEYTEEELGELAKCASDVTYFGNKYCYSMTDDGIAKIPLRDYQKDLLSTFQDNRFVVLLASRQIGKTVTSSIFIAWYLCFHYDRNVMVVANKAATSSEIVDKIRIIFKNLPFFMKPGQVAGGVTGMRFDNGNRLFSSATTKTAAIGFTIHLLYADEFAHVQANYLVPFYRSIYPTLASSKISRIIISSTANGMDNLFYEIYSRAMEGKNFYTPFRVDWWQVPGRDEDWKAQEIANMGSEELFNQEYGNSFLSSSRQLLTGEQLAFLKRTTKEFLWKEREEFLDDPDLFNELRWHPDFDPADEDLKNQNFVLAIDLGDGVKRDYSVINILQVLPGSIASIRRMRDFKDESTFFRLKQVGLFHSNIKSVEEVSRVAECLTYEVFHPEKVKIVLEINFKGNLVIEKLSRHNDYFPGIILHTRHSAVNEMLKQGVKIQKDNKESYCRELRNLVRDRRLVITENKTFLELNSFGMNKEGRYAAQGGHDDIAMTCVNLVPFFNSLDFSEAVEEMFDKQDETFIEAVETKLASAGEDAEGRINPFQMLLEAQNGNRNFDQPAGSKIRQKSLKGFGNF